MSIQGLASEHFTDSRVKEPEMAPVTLLDPAKIVDIEKAIGLENRLKFYEQAQVDLRADPGNPHRKLDVMIARALVENFVQLIECSPNP